MKHVYRIEIQSKATGRKHKFWIGKNLDLTAIQAEAVPCTEAESIQVMERIDIEAVCYRLPNVTDGYRRTLCCGVILYLEDPCECSAQERSMASFCRAARAGGAL